MTIKEYAESKKKMTCADWVKEIEKDSLVKYESQILAVADSLGLISMNESADFVKCVNV